MITFDIDTRELTNKIRKMGVRVQFAASRAVRTAALNIERDAKRACPVDTGRLRSSIGLMSMTADGMGASVGTNVEYAPFVEYGTSRMGAQPYLIPAYETARKWLKAEIEKSLR